MKTLHTLPIAMAVALLNGSACTSTFRAGIDNSSSGGSGPASGGGVGVGVGSGTGGAGGIVVSLPPSGGAYGNSGSGGSAGNGGVVSFGGASGAPGSGRVTSSGGSSGMCAGQAPINHRQSAVQCPSQRGPAPQFCARGGTCTGQPYPSQASGLNLTCSSDSQCAAGVNGRCFPPVLVPIALTQGGCSYDECSADSDCGARTPCICRSSSTVNSANICDPGGNCAVDSDCGPCGYCSPSRTSCYLSSNPNDQAEGSGDPNPYYCHTASDLCTNDSDCAQPDAGMASCPMFASCAYSVQDTRWECTQYPCCGL
jgi:hypothetical protein